MHHFDLFGVKREPRIINVGVFSDEQKNISGRWNYSCCIMIPTKEFDSFYNRLSEIRRNMGYHHELKFHSINSKGVKHEVAKLWLKEIINPENPVYFKILGIDTGILKENVFGEGSIRKGKNYASVYNRFYRTSLLGAKYFFHKFDEIHIDRIFHDKEGNLENSQYFDWHAIYKLKEEQKFKFKAENVSFIDSNHNRVGKYVKASEIIQAVDILLGSFTHCIHQVSNCKYKDEMADIVFPLLQRMINNPSNKNSSYGYYRKFDIGFFPREVPKEYEHLDQYLHRDVSILYSIKYNDKCSGGQAKLF